jgi:hypothetical protein
MPNVLSTRHLARIGGGLLYAVTSNVPWPTLLARTFDVEIKACAGCGGILEVRAVVTDHDIARRILDAMAAAARARPLSTRASSTHPRSRDRSRADGIDVLQSSSVRGAAGVSGGVEPARSVLRHPRHARRGAGLRRTSGPQSSSRIIASHIATSLVVATFEPPGLVPRVLIFEVAFPPASIG